MGEEHRLNDTAPPPADRWADVARRGVVPGAVSGLAGGLVFGAAMTQLGALPTIATLVRAESAAIGFLVHLLIAAAVGVGFGLLTWHQHPGAGEMLFWGLTYGILWWFLGPLTLMPILLGNAPLWTIDTAQAAFPSLLGHLWYGATTAVVMSVLLRWRRDRDPEAVDRDRKRLSLGAPVRGGLAGVLSAWLVGSLLAQQEQLLLFSTMLGGEQRSVAWLILLLMGLVAGLVFGLLYPRSTGGTGPDAIRGTVYGFAWWVGGVVTLLPLLADGHLAWSLAAARERFALLPGFFVYGATMVLLYRGFSGLVRLLFDDIAFTHEQEGVGTQGLRALAWGAGSGAVGGLLFTVVMAQIGFLPAVAGLIGASSQVAGFVVHLGISLLIGASYGLLFRGQTFSLGSALGWGTSYGFLWWIVGALTLMPMLLGAPPQWNAAVASSAIASLIGHLAYGAGLGVAFHLLEARHSPWWIPFRQVEAARITRRKTQLLSSAPAVWVMVIVIALTLPVLLAG